MALSLAPFMDTKLNSDFTPTSNYAANEAKNSALIDQAAQVKQASQRLSGRMNDVTQAIKSHDIMNQGVQDLMIANPELYKQMSEAVKSQEEQQKTLAAKTADFMAGGVGYVMHAKDRGQTPDQAWEDYKNFSRQNGVPLGQFENMPYSDNNLQMLKSSVYGIKGVLEGGSTISKEDGALVTRTPLGDVKDVKVLPQEKTDKPVPLMDAKGNPITVRVPGTNEVKIKMSNGELAPGGNIPTPEKPKEPDRLNAAQRVQYEGQLRDDYRTDSKNFVEIQRQSRIIKQSLNDPSAAGTLAAATSFMKMLDPGSVVRESELGMAMQATGALDRFMNYTNVIQNGKVLTAAQKEEFGRLADQYLEAAKDAQSKLNARYTDIANQYDMNPKNIVMYVPEQSAKPTAPSPIKPVASAQPKPAAQQFRQIKSAADYNALPSGTIFIDPNGVKRRKP